MSNLQAQLGTTCGSLEVSTVACGPVPGAQGCCYYAIAAETVCLGGRPFTSSGRARVAAAVPRSDFRAGLAPDVSRLDAATRRALAAAWERDARYEHASIASFARFALELLSTGGSRRRGRSKGGTTWRRSRRRRWRRAAWARRSRR
jgi:hypothetical protein